MLLLAVEPPVREAEPERQAFPVSDWERGNLKASYRLAFTLS